MLPDSNNSDIALALPEDKVLLLRISEFVADAADCALEQVGPDDNFYETLGVDSLGGVAIFIDISYEFRIPEPSDTTELEALNTPAKLVAYVKAISSGASAVTTAFDPVPVPLDIASILPYGAPFRFVESVLLLEKNRVITTMFWTAEHPLVAAHFVDGPHVVPGVLLAEQVAQSALLFAQLNGFVSSKDHLLLSQLRCDFRSTAQAPILIRADVSVRATGHGHFGFVGTCTVEDKELAYIKGIASKVPNATKR